MKDTAKLKIIRKALKKTQGEFGVPFKLTQGTVSDYERGRTAIPPKYIDRVITAYNVNPAWWEKGKKPIFIPGQTNTYTETPESELLKIKYEHLEKENAWLKEKIALLEEKLKLMHA